MYSNEEVNKILWTLNGRNMLFDIWKKPKLNSA